MKLDLRLYVITTSLPQLGRDHRAVAEAALAGGATMLQFRDKQMGDSVFAATAADLLTMARAAGVPLIVNDRVEIAAAIGADGVHVGQEDLAIGEVRRMTPRGMIVGVSATCYDEAVAACDGGADYVGVGPVFPTGSKADSAPPMGVTELERICREIPLPVVAIGGITISNLRSIVEAGAAGAALIAAIAEAQDMREATKHLKCEWERWPRTAC